MKSLKKKSASSHTISGSSTVGVSTSGGTITLDNLVELGLQLNATVARLSKPLNYGSCTVLGKTKTFRDGEFVRFNSPIIALLSGTNHSGHLFSISHD